MGNSSSFITQNFDTSSGEYDFSIYTSRKGLKCLRQDQEEYLVRLNQEMMIANAIKNISIALELAKMNKENVDYEKYQRESMIYYDAEGQPIPGLEWNILSDDISTFQPTNIFREYANDSTFMGNSAANAEKKVAELQRYLLNFKRWQDRIIERRKAACDVNMK